MKRKQHTGGSVIDGAEQSVLSPPESLNQHSNQAPALSASLCITQASRPCLLTNPGPKPSSLVREISVPPPISPTSEHTYVRESSVDCDVKGDSDVHGGFGDQIPPYIRIPRVPLWASSLQTQFRVLFFLHKMHAQCFPCIPIALVHHAVSFQSVSAPETDCMV